MICLIEQIKVIMNDSNKQSMSVTTNICADNALAQMTAMASVVQNPTAPYPLFYNTSDCGGAISGSNAPSYYFSSDCSSKTIPTFTDNCLRIINDFDGTFDPFASISLPANAVNVLPGGQNELGQTIIGNLFNDMNARLLSWFCPPGYKFIFYSGNPMTHTLAQASQGGILEVLENQIQSNACLNYVTMTNGQPFFQYAGGADPRSCLLAWCGACTPSNFGLVQPGDYCKVPAVYKPCPALTHAAPYLIIIKFREFGTMIQQMCVDNTKYYLGTQANSLNTVWSGQTTACDNYITNLCATGDVSNAQLCSCFTQQQALNVTYGADLGVSVCCFGRDPSGDIKQACSFNPRAYKTYNMNKACCSFAVCEQTVNSNNPVSEAMREKTPTPGKIECANSFVTFPVVPVPAPPDVSPTVIMDVSSSIPIYSWILFVTAVILLFLFVFSLAFV